MFKKNILAITLTSTLAMLSGCDSDNSSTDNDDQKPTPTNVLQYVNMYRTLSGKRINNTV